MRTPPVRLLARAVNRLTDVPHDEALAIKLAALLRAVARLKVTPAELRRVADYLDGNSHGLAELLQSEEEEC